MEREIQKAIFKLIGEALVDETIVVDGKQIVLGLVHDGGLEGMVLATEGEGVPALLAVVEVSMQDPMEDDDDDS